MPHIFLGELFALENMPKVSSAIVTYYFNPSAIHIGYPFHSARNFIVKTWPPAAGMKFIFRTVQGCLASSANVGPSCKVIVVLVPERHLGTLVNDDVFFFRC